METASFNNGNEGSPLSNDPDILKLQLQVLQLRQAEKAAFATAATPSLPVKEKTRLKPLPTTPKNLSFATPPLETPSGPTALSISKPPHDAFRTVTELAKQLPNIDDALLQNQTKFHATLMTITTKEQQLFCAVPPHLFASAVLTKCTGKASLLLSQFSGQDLSLSWDKIKATLTAEFSTELVHLEPFLKLATLSSSRLSADQIIAHSDSLVFHEAVCGTVDWKFYQTLTLCQLTNPALYRFVISPTLPLSFHDLHSPFHCAGPVSAACRAPLRPQPSRCHPANAVSATRQVDCGDASAPQRQQALHVLRRAL